MKCNLCGEDKSLVKSHTIPRSFFKLEGGEAFVVASNIDNDHPKKSRIGPYDKDSICADCENIFDKWDDYGKKFLSYRDKPLTLVVEGEKSEKIIHVDFNYNKLKLFFLSVLLRAHFSKQPFFSRIKLGPHLAKLRSMIMEGNPGNSDEYPVFLVKYENFIGEGGGLSPISVKIDGRKGYLFYFGEFSATILMDKRTIPESLKGFELAHGKKTVIVLNDFNSSNYRKMLVKIAKKNFSN